MSNLEELAVLVTQMRTAQRLYFRHRLGMYLERSKQYEREVDEVLRRILAGPQADVPVQPEMFSDGQAAG